MKRNDWTFGCWLASVLLVSVIAARAEDPGHESDAGEDRLGTKCEYGITLALAGEMDKSEEIFTSLLSESVGDARAYNNLGNIHFLRGDLKVALVFYDKGKVADGDDAGIRLNRATTLMLLGDEDAARAEAAAAVEMAGGPSQLSKLIGLEAASSATETEEESGKASEKTYVSRAEVSALIAGVSNDGAAEADSLAAPEDTESKKRTRLWRSSGPKAADDTEAALVLYWKN